LDTPAAELPNHDSHYISVVSADSACRAISHLLDASLQRIGKRGRVLIDIDSNSGGPAPSHVQVIIADTGVEMMPQLSPSQSSVADPLVDAPAGRSAVDAMSRVSQGVPVSNGLMGLRVAERFMHDNGGSLSIGRWRDEEKDVEYVRTTMTFLRPKLVQRTGAN
jgi:hypothetical protein